MTAWVDHDRCGQDDMKWVQSRAAQEWLPQDDVQAALQLAEWIRRGEQTTWTTDDSEWASRLLPQVCRTLGTAQEKRQERTEPDDEAAHTPAAPPSVRAGVVRWRA